MRISFAHVRDRAANGGWVDYAVFDARSTTGGDTGNADLLMRLTATARRLGLKIDQSALAYSEGGRIRFYGTRTLVDHLSRAGVPAWTHFIDV